MKLRDSVTTAIFLPHAALAAAPPARNICPRMRGEPATSGYRILKVR